MELQLGATLQSRRRELGLTQEQLAGAVGVSPPAVSKWETGRSLPDISLLPRLARALRITVDALLSFQGGLPKERVPQLEEEARERFRAEGFRAGMAHCEDLLHEYPDSVDLKFRLAFLYQTCVSLLGANPPTDSELREAAGRAAALFEQVRESGSPDYAIPAVTALAAHAMGEEDYAKAERLLDSLPKPTADPAALYASLYLAQGRLDEARTLSEYQLYAQVHSACLSLILLLRLARQEGRKQDALTICRIYTGLTGLLNLPEIAGPDACIQVLTDAGEREEALCLFEEWTDRLVDLSYDLSGHPLFSRIQLKAGKQEAESIRKLFARQLAEGEDYGGLRQEPRFQAALHRLQEAAEQD